MQWSYGTSFAGGPDRDAPLVTDRPDFTESPVTVGVGVCQLEMGYTYGYDDAATGSTEGHAYPGALLRVGVLAEWLELRFGWTAGQVSETAIGGPSITTVGSEDLYLGAKLALTPQECLLPETGLILQMTVPSGSSDFTADEVLPGVNLIYGWEITDRLATTGQSQLNRAVDDGSAEPYMEFSQSWTVGLSLTERIGCYAEWFTFVPTGADTNHNEHYLDGGFTFLATNDLQFDVLAGVGLNEAAEDYFVGTGLSVRR